LFFGGFISLNVDGCEQDFAFPPGFESLASFFVALSRHVFLLKNIVISVC